MLYVIVLPLFSPLLSPVVLVRESEGFGGVYAAQDSKSKARELSSWETDLKRREAVGFCSPFHL
jgi:hypothetical protein